MTFKVGIVRGLVTQLHAVLASGYDPAEKCIVAVCPGYCRTSLTRSNSFVGSIPVLPIALAGVAAAAAAMAGARHTVVAAASTRAGVGATFSCGDAKY